MLSFSPEKLFIVGIIALIVLGPQRLPEAARSVGRFIATFRRLSSGIQAEMRDVLAEPREAFNEAMGDFPLPPMRRPARQVISAALSPPTPAIDERPEADPPEPADPSGPSGDSPLVGHPDDPSLN